MDDASAGKGATSDRVASGSRAVFLVRHGRTELNAAGLLRGRLDPPLDEIGRHEAEALGVLFEAVPVDLILSSPLQRARQTAARIAAATRAPLRADDAFADRDYGCWAGHDRAEVEARYGSLDRAPDVEPLDALVTRSVSELRAHAAAVGTLVVVAHDAVNRAMLARLAANVSDDPESIPQRTGCWNRLECRDGTWLASVVDAIPGDGRRPG